MGKASVKAAAGASRDGKATLADIARSLGIDKSSVSLALRDSPKISEGTKERVRQAAQSLGYRPNIAARQLRKGGHLAMGLALPMGTLDCNIAVRTIQELSRLALAKGVIFSILPARPEKEEAPGRFVPDGLLVWGDIPYENAKSLCEGGCPFAVIDPNHPSYVSADCAAARLDNAGGAAAIVAHLLERGARKLLFVKSQEGHTGHDERAKAARLAWLESRPPHTMSDCLLRELSDEHLKSFASEPHGAIFCSNDQAAAELWHRLAKLSIHPPKGLLLAGFDGDPYGEHFGLTTAAAKPDGLASASFKLLLSLMSGEPKRPRQQTVPVSLRVGATT